MNIDVKNRFKSGNGWAVTAELTFDSSYPTGGEALKPSDLGLSVIETMNIENSAGYTFDYSKADEAVLAYMAGAHTHAISLTGGATAAHTHAFASKPPLVVEEDVTVSSHAGTLENVPLYILAITSAVGTTTGAFRQIPVGKTPLTKQCAVNMTTGGLTFRAADAVTAAKVTYIPKRAAGYLSAVTVDESVTASASTVDLAARAGLIQYVWDNTDGALVDFEQPGAPPSASHFCTVDINDSGDTSIDSHSNDAGHTLLVTYVPYAQLPPGCFIDDADIALTSEAYNFVSAGHYMYPVIPGYGSQIIGETSGAVRSAATLQGPGASAADGVATMNFAKNYLLTDQSTAMTVVSIPWMILDANQLTPFGTNANESAHTHAVALDGGSSGSASAVAAEVGDGTDLHTVVTQLVAYGY